MKGETSINYTCLYSEGGVEGGESFSGAGLVPDGHIDSELDLICGDDGLRHILREALENPPMCIMLHIQVSKSRR